MTLLQKFIVIAFGLVPIIFVRLSKKKQNLQPEPNIKEILESCLIRIKNQAKTLQDIIDIDSNKKILEPFHYVTQIGGKKIRLCMALILSDMYSTHFDQKIVLIGALVEFLHTASLIIDDIEDSSMLRRQKPCTHLVYGLDRSINAANLVYFLPFNKLLRSFEKQIQKCKIIQIFIDQMVTCHLGQAEDVLVHKLERKEDLPSLDEYYRLISAKTSSILRMMVGMIGIVVGIEQKSMKTFYKIMNFVGISFQITDDILNLSRGMGKGIVAEDLYQKKFTIIIHFLRDDNEFMQEFIHPNKSQQSIKKMLNIIQQKKIIPICKKIAQQFSDQALFEVDKLQTLYSKIKFKKLIQFIIQRNS